MKQLLFSGILFYALGIAFCSGYPFPANAFPSEATAEDSSSVNKKTDTACYVHPHYLWINELNAHYTDSIKPAINTMAVPPFHIVHTSSRYLGQKSRYPHSSVRKQMATGAYYLPSLYGYAGYSSMYTAYPYSYKNYSALPPDYSYYSNKSTSSPYIILPKY